VADRIAVINEGKILKIGTPEEVKSASDPLIQEFLHANFKKDVLKAGQHIKS
jgi:ABC-type transporter Mla maintaining outer membrane lipid asymmetry ATPase subunit MlaF